MCGIAGICNAVEGFIDESTLKAMCDAITHRGPDEEGFYINAHVGLGIRRLKVIDLETGQQPVHNEDKTIWAVFNGEIYNFRELRTQLEAKGHQFYSHVDTEVIVHLYEEYGEDFVLHLNGMFAIAIWDRTLEKLVLVRDRLGIKPLCYFVTDEKLVFGSEIKSLLREGGANRSLSNISLDYYFTFGYIPAPYSIFEGIEKLSPGHLLSYKMGKVTIRQYWNVKPGRGQSHDEQYYQEKLYDYIKKAVRRRLVSDVPLGAFLSGGMDSSAIVAMMSQLMDQPVKTFSIGFEEKEYNELHDARVIANHLGTDHTELVVKPDAMELLPRLVELYDEPFADSSAIPTYYVSQLARQQVTVALSGDGGDELFGGYRRYLTDKRDSMFSLVPQFIRANLLGRIGTKMPMFSRGKSYLLYMSQVEERQYLQRVSICPPEIKNYLYSPDLQQSLLNFDAYKWAEDHMAQVGGSELVDQMLYVDLKTYLPYDLLTKVDLASMVHSLEVRVPFLDHELVEFAVGIPHNLKIRGNMSKYILKQTVSDMIPSHILEKKKQGFAIPLAKWFQHELSDFAYDMLTGATFKQRNLFSNQAIENILSRHRRGEADYSPIIWALIFLESWMKTYCDEGSHSPIMAMSAL